MTNPSDKTRLLISLMSCLAVVRSWKLWGFGMRLLRALIIWLKGRLWRRGYKIKITNDFVQSARHKMIAPLKKPRFVI